MDLTSAIDIAVGLVLMYLVLSLLCTTINEFIASSLRLRANTLQAAMQQLIDDPTLKTLFDNHGLIDGSKVAARGGTEQRSNPTDAVAAAITKTVNAQSAAIAVLNTDVAEKPAVQSALSNVISQWRNWKTPDYPSYLSGRNVALALMGSLDPTKPVLDIGGITAAIGALPDSNIRDALLASLVDADGKIDKFRDSVAAWFDGSMDRLSGAYKRNLQLISFIVGLLIAGAFNADTLHVGNALWHDRSLTQVIAQSAPDLMKQLCPENKCPQAPAGTDKNTPLPVAQLTAGFTSAEDSLRAFPIGWATPANVPKDAADFWWKLAGLLITAAALMMGAPFWFDLLQKIMNIRGTGEKPQKTTGK
jgi:hypothetical protein